MKKRSLFLYVCCVTVTLVSSVVVLCLVTYNPADLPHEQYHTGVSSAKNWGGITGAYTAHFLYEWFGFAAFPIIGLAVYWSCTALICGKLEKKTFRAVGTVLFAAGICAFAESLPISRSWLPGAGGILGKFFAVLLVPFLGKPFFGILSGCLSFLSLCLATDARLAPLTANGVWYVLRKAGRFVRRDGPEDSQEEVSPPIPEPEEETETGEETTDEEPPDKSSGRTGGKRETPPRKEQRQKPSAAAAGGFRLPPPSLLTKPEEAAPGSSAASLREESEILNKTLSEFGIGAEVVNIEVGPVIVQYQLELAAGTKVHKVMALSDDLAMALKTPSVRIVAPIPGKSAVGIEVPNKKRTLVRMRELVEAKEFDRKSYEIPLFMGRDCSGNCVFADLAKMPHLLIAGATGAGKTICLNSLIMSMLMTQYPSDLKLLLVDPKMVEMASFKGIPHLISPVVTDMKKAPTILAWAAVKMDERYDVLAAAGVRSLTAYNALGKEEISRRGNGELPEHLPYIVIIIDELADLMSVAAKEVEVSITRLAQKSRAVGIHIILATQRPSVDVITGLIKSNLPTRISFRVTSKIDSRTILDRNGAEKLLGQGDLLLLPSGSTDMIRAQGVFLSDSELRAVVEFIKAQAEPNYYEDLMDLDEKQEGGDAGDDSLYDDAVKIVVETQRGSASLLQRRLGIGYTRASRLIDMMEDGGVVGKHKEAQSRKVLLTPEDLEPQDDNLDQEDQSAS